MSWAVTFYVKKDLRVSLAGTDLIVSNVTEGDAGDYICKLDTDDEIPLTVLGKPSKKKTGNSLVFLPKGGYPPPTHKVWSNFPFFPRKKR